MSAPNEYLVGDKTGPPLSDYASKSELADSFLRSLHIFVDAWARATVYEQLEGTNAEAWTRHHQQVERADLHFADLKRKLKALVQ